VLPHWVHLFSCGARQRCDALRVRRRIFEVLRLGTPIVSGNESTVSKKDKAVDSLSLVLLLLLLPFKEEQEKEKE
jgi:hypothetical protein